MRHDCCHYQFPEQGEIDIGKNRAGTVIGFASFTTPSGTPTTLASSRMGMGARWKNSANCWSARSRYNASVRNR